MSDKPVRRAVGSRDAAKVIKAALTGSSGVRVTSGQKATIKRAATGSSTKKAS